MSCATPDKTAGTAGKMFEQARQESCCGGAREKRLDEALAQTFPASDPVAAEIPAPSRPSGANCGCDG